MIYDLHAIILWHSRYIIFADIYECVHFVNGTPYLGSERALKICFVEHPAPTFVRIHGDIVWGGSYRGGVQISMEDMAPRVTYALADAGVNVHVQRDRLVDHSLVIWALDCERVVMEMGYGAPTVKQYKWMNKWNQDWYSVTKFSVFVPSARFLMPWYSLEFFIILYKCLHSREDCYQTRKSWSKDSIKDQYSIQYRSIL